MNRIDLQGRTAVVTGGAQGIGYAVCERLLASGASVMLWDIDESLLARSVQALNAQAQAQGLPGRALGHRVELTDDDAIAEATQALFAAFPQLDIVVNNAGITGGNGPTWDLDPQVWRRVIEVNLVAPYLVCRHLVPPMKARGYGRIVNIASVAGKEGNPNASHYSASKAGLISLTKSLAKELATSGVLVNCVTPAAAKTAIFDQMTQAHLDYMLSKIPMGRFVEVDEIAAMVAWLASQDCSFSTGAVFDITGGRATY